MALDEKNKKTNVKGQPGYLLHHKKIYGLWSLIGFLLVLAVFTVSYIIYQDARNYFNILSVLILLPTVKIYVQYSMLPWKNQIDPEQYASLKNTLGTIPVYCELLMTGSEKRFEILYLVIGPGEEILAFSKDLKSDPALFQKSVYQFLNYYNYDAKVTLYHDYEAYQKAVEALAAQYPTLSDEELNHIATVFEKVSIMSI